MRSLDFSINLIVQPQYGPGSTQLRTEMCIRNLPAIKGRPARKVDSLATICQPIVQKMWEPRRPITEKALTFFSNALFGGALKY
jgi:hypothetical protein